MKEDDVVKLAPAKGSKSPADAKVQSVRQDGGSVCLIVAVYRSPWFRKFLASRGVFIGKGANYTMFLFRDHNGTWTDVHSLEQFTITESP